MNQPQIVFMAVVKMASGDPTLTTDWTGITGLEDIGVGQTVIRLHSSVEENPVCMATTKSKHILARVTGQGKKGILVETCDIRAGISGKECGLRVDSGYRINCIAKKKRDGK